MRKLASSKDCTRDLFEESEKDKRNSISSSAKGNLELASRAIQEGNFDKALIFLEKGLEIEPNNSSLIYLRAKIYAWKKEYENCLEEVEYMLQINPSDPEALNAKKILNSLLDYHKKVTQFPIYS